ncbi:MAG TPA: PKD domain-containing protein [Thermoanaerobaculia bacterium]|nr:PKD domain-containing protein [Thermoanaerobaculia bacterium]
MSKLLQSVLPQSILVGLCVFTLPLVSVAGENAQKQPKSGKAKTAAVSQAAPAPQPTPAEIKADYQKLKAENKEKDKQQKEEYLRAVPPPAGAEILDGDSMKTHAAREWYLLTYPTGTLPPMPWSKARAWVNRHVPDAAPWAGSPLRPGHGNGNKSELGGMTAEATVSPGNNIWVPFGPQPLDSVGTTNNAYQFGIVAGRVGESALVVDPNNPGTAYAGFTAGGLWKTTDLGLPTVTWTPLWEDKDFVTQSVGAIEIDPTDSNTLYAGTGDWPALDQFSEGIMKSTDGGATWTHLGADVFTPYAPALPAGGNKWSNQNIKVIKVDPKDPQNVLVGTRYDLYLSNDGGSSWQICPFGNNYTDPAAGTPTPATSAINRVSGLYLDTRGTTTVVYVAVGYMFDNGNGNNGVYRFTMPSSGCPAWPSDFTTLFGGLPAGTGNGINRANGGSITGRTEITGAIGPDARLTLYLQVADATSTTAEGTYVLRPDGGATTWTKLTGSTSTAYKNCANGASDTAQDWYDLFIAADPANDKTLYIGHIDAFKATVNSTYTSMTLSNLTNVYSSGCASYGKVHPDQHAFAFVPGTNGSTFLLGNDGGVFYNNNRGDVNAWKQLNDSFNTNQFYAGQIGADFAGNGMGGLQWVFGGMQDNGNSSWDSTEATLKATGRSVGGDGFFTSFDPLGGTETTGWWISEYTYGSLYCSSTGADGPFSRGGFPTGSCGPSMTGSADWSAPFMIDALHCTNAQCRNHIFGEDYVHAAGSYGTYGPVWSRISGSLVKTSGGSIISVNLAPSNPKGAAVGTSDGKVWWSETIYNGTACTQAAANTSSFACTPNTTAVWRDVDSTNATLPNRVILGVAFDPTDHTRIYAAVGGFNENTPTTPGHLFEFKWNGSAWTRVNKTGNLPNVPASSVAVNPHDRRQVFVGTHFGFYYTADIDAANVVWNRYQHGLPNTVIKHLTIDRGPASDPLKGTTLAAFTYGRGVYAIRLPGPGGFGSTSTNLPPIANFTQVCTNLTCDFTDLSTDADGTIAARSWTFGDGGTSTAQNPSRTYAAAGTYTVTLSVTDNGGATSSTSKSVTVTAPAANIALSVRPYLVSNKHRVDLTWSGATSTNVDVYRNGIIITTTPNDGAHTDAPNKRGSATYTYKVCNAGTTVCSNEATATF